MERQIASSLLSIGAMFLRPGEPFTWASGIKSPIYCDNRLTLSAPAVREQVENGLAAPLLGLPMGYVRGEAKSHGRTNRIEGRMGPGTKVVVIEDLISTGVNLVTSSANGILNHNKRWISNFAQTTLGNFYLDENKNIIEQIWKGISRFTWEAPQQVIGYGWSDRVDLWGGATFVTDENAKSHQGITLGAFINGDIKSAIPSGASFDTYVESLDQVYAHEYGHTLYPVMGLLSLGSAIADYELKTGHNHDSFFIEVMANRFSSPVFPSYIWGEESGYPIVY